MASRVPPFMVFAGGFLAAVVGAVLKLQAGCNLSASPTSSYTACIQSALVDQNGMFHNVIPGNLTYDFLGIALVVLGIGLIFISFAIALVQDQLVQPPTETGASPQLTGASSVVPPACPVCGDPLVRILEHERWYCLRCKEFR